MGTFDLCVRLRCTVNFESLVSFKYCLLYLRGLEEWRDEQFGGFYNLKLAALRCSLNSISDLLLKWSIIISRVSFNDVFGL